MLLLFDVKSKFSMSKLSSYSIDLIFLYQYHHITTHYIENASLEVNIIFWAKLWVCECSFNTRYTDNPFFT